MKTLNMAAADGDGAPWRQHRHLHETCNCFRSLNCHGCKYNIGFGPVNPYFFTTNVRPILEEGLHLNRYVSSPIGDSSCFGFKQMWRWNSLNSASRDLIIELGREVSILKTYIAIIQLGFEVKDGSKIYTRNTSKLRLEADCRINAGPRIYAGVKDIRTNRSQRFLIEILRYSRIKSVR